MAVSVIISNFNGFQYLPRLMESLKGQIGCELEIIVVDRKSTDESASFLKSISGITVISEPPESGLVAGYHVGSLRATKENLFFCNEDMWFEADCLEQLEKAIDLEKGIVAADPWQWSYDGKERIHAGTQFIRTGFSLNSPHPFYAMNFDCELLLGSKIPFPCAGAFLISAKQYREWGGWDSSYFLNHEDIDLFIRGWQRGESCVAVPEAKVYHACGASNQKTIAKGKVSVGKRRYLSNFSSLVIFNFKYFSFPYFFYGFLSMAVRMAGNLLRLRLRYFAWDFLVIGEVVRRFSNALKFRYENRKWNQSRPGEKFFCFDEFIIK